MNELLFSAEIGRTEMEEYEDLLCLRDQLSKEAASLLISYTKTFGDLITGNFELKIECIKLKKQIAYCQKQINQGKKIDADRMDEEIEKDMMLYYLELKDLINRNDSAKKSRSVGDYRFRMSKKIYRRLAKRLHPDINKKTMQEPRLAELWNRIVAAYKKSDVNELDDLEILVNKVLKELGDSGFEPVVDDIEIRIERVRNQINEILTTEPYIYNKLLSSEEKIRAKTKELEEEKEKYSNYLQELTDILDKLLLENGIRIRWTS